MNVAVPPGGTEVGTFTQPYSQVVSMAVLQQLVQFICGYYDLDLRDCAHVAHGRLILRWGSPQQLAVWRPRLLAGDLIGIAATERQGGSALHRMRLRAYRDAGNEWVVSGEKCWISRIEEAVAFVVFFKTGDSEEISAAIVPVTAARVCREKYEPDGLRGWSWGRLRFDEARIGMESFLGRPGHGLEIFREHFEYYRPMVAATALGAAAATFDRALEYTRARVREGVIDRPRDSVLETIGRSFVEIQAALLAAIVAEILASRGIAHGSVWTRLSKAHGVDTAFRAVQSLSLLLGAAAFESNHPVAKRYRDLRGLLYADGVHDALLQSAGRLLVQAEYPAFEGAKTS